MRAAPYHLRPQVHLGLAGGEGGRGGVAQQHRLLRDARGPGGDALRPVQELRRRRRRRQVDLERDGRKKLGCRTAWVPAGRVPAGTKGLTVGCCAGAGWAPLPPEEPLCLFAARLAWGEEPSVTRVAAPQHPWVPPGRCAVPAGRRPGSGAGRW